LGPPNLRVAAVSVAGEDRPFWSVMIPTYEPRREYLSEMLESVLQQDPGRDQMQIEVVDDCSPHVDVVSMVHRLAGDRVRVFTNDSNLGLARCWNRCIERSAGRWVHLLHQDDRLHSRFYKSMESLISTHPEAMVAFCQHEFIDSSGKVTGVPPPLQEAAGCLRGGVKTLAVKNKMQCPAVLVRRDAYEQAGGFDPQLKYVVDWEMWMRLASRFQVVYTTDVLASHRVHSESESSRLSDTGETVYDMARVIGTLNRYVSQEDLAEVQQLARTWMANMAIHKSRSFIESRQPEQAMQQLRALLAVDKTARSWRRAVQLWLSAMLKSKRFVMPPLVASTRMARPGKGRRTTFRAPPTTPRP